ncbi:ABC transporter ATP-binding protein [Albibacterium sp.]|uniref:ABC transporter ATP-binding protein n=1 Tax=Albibacterium sp. TaxID=2952885 RepID=UPI002BEDB3D1|nr:ABC transporter ATP-binding protein [Albibacterium sp.]HUH18712.1 ABC transporter ATP-binding protein [Albibacterium sp.]
MNNKKIVASLKDVSKVYKTGDTTIIALDNTTVDIYSHELTLIMGPSGSGKTTLLSILGSVVYPSSGEVLINNENISAYSENKLAAIRLQKIGFVFQQFNLLQPLTALENVLQPLILSKMDRVNASKLAKSTLEKVNIADKMHTLPRKLSGGQKQRVAIARALVTDPPILLCDEPTASLDSKSASFVMEELRLLANEGKAVVVVTHDLRLRKYADRIMYVEEGKLSDNLKNEEDYK